MPRDWARLGYWEGYVLCGASLGLGATLRCGFLLAQVPGVVWWSAANGCSRLIRLRCVVMLHVSLRNGVFLRYYPFGGLFGVFQRSINYGQHLMTISQAIIDYYVACKSKRECGKVVYLPLMYCRVLAL